VRDENSKVARGRDPIAPLDQRRRKHDCRRAYRAKVRQCEQSPRQFGCVVSIGGPVASPGSPRHLCDRCFQEVTVFRNAHSQSARQHCRRQAEVPARDRLWMSSS
jgi:hypothetical protein